MKEIDHLTYPYPKMKLIDSFVNKNYPYLFSSVATLESLIVCITIIYANICVIGGKEEERQHQHGDVEGVSGGPPQGTEGSPQGPEGNRLQDSQEAECLKRRKWWFWVLISKDTFMKTANSSILSCNSDRCSTTCDIFEYLERGVYILLDKTQ